MPLNPRVVDLMPFSATLQWDPPSDNGGSSLPLTYTVNITNTSASLPFSNITATSLPLPYLQHGTQYSWSVQAINDYGSSPPAEGTFTTPDSGMLECECAKECVSVTYVCSTMSWANVALSSSPHH